MAAAFTQVRRMHMSTPFLHDGSAGDVPAQRSRPLIRLFITFAIAFLLSGVQAAPYVSHIYERHMYDVQIPRECRIESQSTPHGLVAGHVEGRLLRSLHISG